MADYDSNTKEGKCIFCEIATGRMKTPGVFWEDDKYMAFLSLFPNTEGFTVVIPKQHASSDVLSLPDEELTELVLAAKKVASILENYFEDVGRVGLIMEGTGVDHAHIKLFPVHATEGLKEGKWEQVHSDIDKYFEKYEGYISSHDSHMADEEKLSELAEKIKNSY